MTLESIHALESQPKYTVVIADGAIDFDSQKEHANSPTVVIEAPKHEPGMEQPRNRGVHVVQEIEHQEAMLRQGYPATHVWFLDSDIIIAPEALTAYETAMEEDPTKRVMVGPYDWLPEAVREARPDIQNDIRWPSFDEFPASKVFTNDLSAGLACLGGNLIWPIDEFVRIGGFWNELYHGRCEDGELGLRAVACGIPISYVAGARGWHLSHPINTPLILERNERDVPMLNDRHPWVQGEGLFVVEEDGKRFNVQCPCGWQGNTAEIWHHKANCEKEGWDV